MSPDGLRYVAVTGTGLSIVDVVTGQGVPVQQSQGRIRPVWTAGGIFATSSNDTGLWRVDSASLLITTLAQPGDDTNTPYLWSVGTRVAYAAWRDPGRPFRPSRRPSNTIVALDLQSGEIRTAYARSDVSLYVEHLFADDTPVIEADSDGAADLVVLQPRLGPVIYRAAPAPVLNIFDGVADTPGIYYTAAADGIHLFTQSATDSKIAAQIPSSNSLVVAGRCA